MEVLTLCKGCGCKLQVSTDETKATTTFICPACSKVNILVLSTAITETAATTSIVSTNNAAVNSNRKPIMTEQLALEQLKMFCVTN